MQFIFIANDHDCAWLKCLTSFHVKVLCAVCPQKLHVAALTINPDRLLRVRIEDLDDTL